MNINKKHIDASVKEPGADPGILVRGAWIFFKGIGFGGHLKAPPPPSGYRAIKKFKKPYN